MRPGQWKITPKLGCRRSDVVPVEQRHFEYAVEVERPVVGDHDHPPRWPE